MKYIFDVAEFEKDARPVKWSLTNSHHYIGNVRKANEISIKAGRSRAKDRDAKQGAPVNLFGIMKGIGIDKFKVAHRKDDDNIRPDLKITVKSISRPHWGLRRV